MPFVPKNGNGKAPRAVACRGDLMAREIPPLAEPSSVMKPKGSPSESSANGCLIVGKDGGDDGKTKG